MLGSSWTERTRSSTWPSLSHADFAALQAFAEKWSALSRSRGFGFVTFTSSQSANEAVKETNEQEWMGRTLRVNNADARPPQRRDFNRERTDFH